MKTNMGSTKNGARVPHVLNRFTSMDIDMNSQILPDMLINFALINITDRKNEGINTIDVTGSFKPSGLFPPALQK